MRDGKCLGTRDTREPETRGQGSGGAGAKLRKTNGAQEPQPSKRNIVIIVVVVVAFVDVVVVAAIVVLVVVAVVIDAVPPPPPPPKPIQSSFSSLNKDAAKDCRSCPTVGSGTNSHIENTSRNNLNH